MAAMDQFTALFALAYRRQDIHFVCETCGQRRPEPVTALADRFGPLVPLARLAQGSYCRKCGSMNMRVEAE